MQLEIFFEKEFFHWITTKALAELRNSGRIGSSIEALADVGQIRFYFHIKNRYWKRKSTEIRKLVTKFSESNFTAALGNQGETLVDAALPSVGFIPRARNVSEFNGVPWTRTGHNLDRAFEKDGVFYGTEIKNRLSYISRDELYTKLEICDFLRIRPLFVARMMPKSYIHELHKRGGFALLMGRQFYPFGSGQFAAEVREKLNLPVDTPTRLADGTLQRLLNYHERSRPRRD